MNSRKPTASLLLTAGLLAAGLACAATLSQQVQGVPKDAKTEQSTVWRYDTIVMPWGEMRIDSVRVSVGSESGTCREFVAAEMDSTQRYSTLTDADFRKAAEELGVEVAAIKAVVRIEAGAKMEGFWAPGVPVINFDRSMYNKSRAPRSVKASSSEKVPDGIKSTYGRREWSQLVAARKVNLDKANMGTFWGMFQIGGFNYKLCGCSSVQEFVDRMSYSEFEQLELFCNFIRNSGMLDALKAKNWSSFARKYNGPSYARRGYHTRMASEYRKFKAQEQKTEQQEQQQEQQEESK